MPGRERSRERDRSRDRERSRRSRSPARERSGWDAPAPASTSRGYTPPPTQAGVLPGYAGGLPAAPAVAPQNMQALVALQQQQAELQRQQMLQSLLLQQQALASIPGVTIGGIGGAPAVGVVGGAAAVVGSSAAPSPATKKGREIYVGNLAVGIMTPDLVRELFNSALANFTPDPVTNPPIVDIKMDSTGRFCFLEMRTLDLAAHLMELDKMEVCGRPLKIGRPKGYEDEANKLLSQQKLSMAQTYAAQLSGGPTNVVLLENLVPAKNVLDPAERREIYDDVFAEAVKCGPVAGVAVPVPPNDIPDDEPCRVYVKYHSIDDAKKCKEMMEGRAFDDRTVKASFSNEFDFTRAQQGEWVQAAPAIQQIQQIPGVGMPPGVVPGMPGVLPQVTLGPGITVPVLPPPPAL